MDQSPHVAVVEGEAAAEEAGAALAEADDTGADLEPCLAASPPTPRAQTVVGLRQAERTAVLILRGASRAAALYHFGVVSEWLRRGQVISGIDTIYAEGYAVIVALLLHSGWARLNDPRRAASHLQLMHQTLWNLLGAPRTQWTEICQPLLWPTTLFGQDYLYCGLERPTTQCPHLVLLTMPLVCEIAGTDAFQTMQKEVESHTFQHMTYDFILHKLLVDPSLLGEHKPRHVSNIHVSADLRLSALLTPRHVYCVYASSPSSVDGYYTKYGWRPCNEALSTIRLKVQSETGQIRSNWHTFCFHRHPRFNPYPAERDNEYERMSQSLMLFHQILESHERLSLIEWGALTSQRNLSTLENCLKSQEPDEEYKPSALSLRDLQRICERYTDMKSPSDNDDTDSDLEEHGEPSYLENEQRRRPSQGSSVDSDATTATEPVSAISPCSWLKGWFNKQGKK